MASRYLGPWYSKVLALELEVAYFHKREVFKSEIVIIDSSTTSNDKFHKMFIEDHTINSVFAHFGVRSVDVIDI